MTVSFDRFAFDSARRELLDQGQPVHLPPKSYRLLEILIESAPRALSKKDLHEAIWPQTFVEEGNLAGLVNDLRTALGDHPRKPRFVRTVHGFGYAFCCALSEDSAPVRAGTIVFRGQELPLRAGTNILGRDASADVQIDDPTVSRNHATITLSGDNATIEDLDSKNGTFLDGEKLRGSAALAEGQKIVLGDAAMIFRRTLTSASTVSVLRPSTAGSGQT
jgi:DNA-binding winged helix-turn-helix (wHTH) protein